MKTVIAENLKHDITPAEVADWVTDEFFAVAETDIFALVTRIEKERAVIEANAHLAEEFPQAFAAHCLLLRELQERYEMEAAFILSTERTLN